MASTENRVAIITGAASGMGLAVTKHLLAKGWRVCISDVNKQQGDALAVELGDNALFVGADVTDYDSQARVFESVWLKWKRIDFVAANAGIVDNFPIYKAGESTRPTGPPPKPDLKTIDIDLNGAIYTVYLALHYMRINSTPGGKITMTASSAALYPLDTVPLYAAAKHAIIGLIRSMAPVLKSENITLNCFCPGLIDTSLTGRLISMIPADYVTPMASVLRAYDRFIDGTETGCTAEISKDRIFMREPPAYPDRFQEWQMENLGPIGKKAREMAQKK
ncbi:hypothetical protein V501_01909 [Pseudogymnoascus sp. VKM F-4519 (FW-2642)]|nr:hypothetical protein V500_04898 [Pseudogymnoascus sp. VKM F-4518 (FW-2643)]KFZ17118.1 hypothetical protein V501_01909 [Pseudogymnoascus sp. VKM F-4519 (FW-2642)]